MKKLLESVYLSCITSNHDKVYNIFLYDEGFGNDSAFSKELPYLPITLEAEYGPRCGVLKHILKETFKWESGGRSAMQELIEEKLNKGYHVNTGNPTPTSYSLGDYLNQSKAKKAEKKPVKKEFDPNYTPERNLDEDL